MKKKSAAGAVGKRAVVAERRLPKRYTGRMLVRLDPEAGMEKIVKQAKTGGLNLVVGLLERGAGAAARAAGAEGKTAASDGFVLDRLRIAVVEEAAADKVPGLMKERGSVFLSAEPERVLRLLPAGSKGRGGKKTVLKDNTAATWGIQAMRIPDSKYTGKGVKVAVLDTGFDFTHPDFAGRTMHRRSFIGTKQAIDKEGHGTHTAAVVGGGRKTKGGGGPAKHRARAMVWRQARGCISVRSWTIMAMAPTVMPSRESSGRWRRDVR